MSVTNPTCKEITQLDEAGLTFLMKEEGVVLKPYLDDAGVPTIGVGCTYYEDGSKVKMSDPPITYKRAMTLFHTLLKGYELEVYSRTRDDINQNQFNALVSLCFNIGRSAFKSSTVLKRVNAKAGKVEIEEAFKMWRNATVKGVKKPILLKRRIREAALYNK